MGNEAKQVFYTGIGAREAPKEILSMIEKIGGHMARKGYILRSGAAEGSSTSFEKGCDEAGGKKLIFLPWRGFNGNNSPLYTIPDRAFDIVKGLNPAWSAQSDSTKKLQARYAMTMLGQQVKEPSACVLCYTPGGKQKGGTGFALKIAQKYRIPVFDIGAFEQVLDSVKDRLIDFLEGLSLSGDGLVI